MTSNTQHCSFVLLAEFDIDRGAQLTYQFPWPLGTDEGLLATLMLPDGAEKQLEDWTIFFLNQTPFNTIAPVLALETPEEDGKESNGDPEDRPELLYVLNLVRTKHDKSVRRGAVVKAMAICTRHPFIQIFKPVLLMALDDYYNDPSQDALARLYDAVNSMDISSAPVLSRQEKLVMRCSDRKDTFAEKFATPKEPIAANFNFNPPPPPLPRQAPIKPHHRPSNSQGSQSSFEDGIMMRKKERARTTSASSLSQSNPNNSPPSDSSFSLGGSAVWVGDESELDTTAVGGTVAGSASSAVSVGSSTIATSRGRKSTDASESSSSHGRGKENNGYGVTSTTTSDTQFRAGSMKDTHFFQTTIAYKGHQLPIKMPLSSFPEEVGDYSLIQLVQTLSNPSVVVSGPLHPHLHTNGSLTHPVMILFNALVTGKRILFLGHNRPAGQVSSYVLSACALGSGCGAVLRGFTERAFPYANLTNRVEWEVVPAYIAGVCNPIFETSGSWDILFDVGGSRVVVSKDIHTTFPPSSVATPIIPLATRIGTLKAESSVASEDDMVRASAGGPRSDFTAKTDSADNLFMEDIISAISCHYTEGHIRTRFSEYVVRFVRLASRYEEDAYGSTKFGYPSTSFSENPGSLPQLGSGIVFIDEALGVKELISNASRIEAWRRTTPYMYLLADHQKARQLQTIRGFDVLHQLHRLRHVKNMPDPEVELIMRSIAESLQSYEQIVELLAYLTPSGGGLLPLSFGLFHQQESVRESTVDIFNELRAYPIGVLFLQSLNHFQRYAYVRQAHARESRQFKETQTLHVPLALYSRTPSNRSESSLGAS